MLFIFPKNFTSSPIPSFSALPSLSTSSNFSPTKFPYLDTVWDFFHTFIRPPAAAVLAFGVSAGLGAEWRWAAALLAGGIALTSHGAKASTRRRRQHHPRTLFQWALSIGEDLLAVWLTWFTTAHPILAIVLVALLVILCFYLIFKLFHFLRRSLQTL